MMKKWSLNWGMLFAFLMAAVLVMSVGVSGILAGNTDTPLAQELTYGICSDTEAYQVKVAGVGMGGATTGNIALSLPSTATVEKALLYWTGRDPFEGGDGVVRFEGSLVNGIQTGGPAFWGTNSFAFAYKADVTSFVSPSKTSYSLEDPSTGDSDSFDVPYGAALVVIYKDNAISTPTLVETWEGMDIAKGDTEPVGSEGTSPVVFQFDPAALPRTATFTTIVGGVAPSTTADVYYIYGSGTPPSTNSDIFGLSGVTSEALPASEDGNWMTTYDKSITVPAGTTWLAVQVRSGTAELHWLAETLQLEAACPKVQVTKTLTAPASGLAHVGDTVTFQIQVQNTGNTNLTVVPLRDTYDTNYLQFTGTASPVPDDTTDDGQLDWADITTSLGDIAPGDTKTVTVSFVAKAGTQSLAGDVTTNTATVSGVTDQNGKTPPDDSDNDVVEISNPSISIVKTRTLPASPDGIATVGETVRFTIVVENTGDTILTTVPLEDSYDTTYLSFQSASPAPVDNTDDGTLNWSNIGPLNPGATQTVTVEFQAKASTWDGNTHAKTYNHATVSATDENGEAVGPENDSDWVEITHPAVTVTKERVSDAYEPINGQVTYRITVINTGDTVLDTVPVVDTFPTDYLDYNSDTSGQTPAVNDGAGTVTWNDVTGSGSLAVGASLTFNVVFDVTASSNPTSITNIACVDGAVDVNGDEPAQACDDIDVVTTNPHLTITKERITDSPVLVGDQVQFRITIQNDGDTTVTVLPLTDTFDDTYLQFVSASPAQDNLSGGTLTWNDLTASGSDLAPGGSVQVVLTFQSLASTTSSGPTVDTATVSGAQDEHGDTVPTVSDTADVAILSPASIGDKVWEDTNGNGVQDAGEPGIANVTVKLYTSSGTLVGTDTTDTNGEYGFEHLYPGDYYLVFVKPSGYEFTAQDQGSNDAVDSDPASASGQTAITTLSEGENDTTWDAGLYQPASLGDYVWEDMNGDGLQTAGEPGVDNVTVKLYYAGPDGDFNTAGDNQVFTTQTAGSGAYSFTSLAPGTYKLEFVVPSGWAVTLQNEGSDPTNDSDPDRTTAMTAPFSLASGQTDNTWDAGLYQPASIGDFTWVDSNANGVYDSGESPLPNVTLTLYDASNNVVATTTSNGSGIYTFDGLLPGTYTVQVTTPAGYVATTSTSYSRTLSSGDAVTDADFGFISPTAVEIETFNTVVGQDGVHISWRTHDEFGVTQFRLQRAMVQYGPWQDISTISATGSPSGATYNVVDHNVQPGYTYYYRLVSEPDGTISGPWSVYVPKTWEPGGGIQSGHQVFLPLLSR